MLKNSPKWIQNKLLKEPLFVFLIDGIGAFISAFFLGFVLKWLANYVHIPPKMLCILTLPALVYMFFSLACYVAKVKNWAFFLKITLAGNIFYFCLSIFATFIFYPSINILGLIYLGSECLILLFLICLEYELITQKYAQK
jgi:hypothetical protein